jgi:hypothetical protein
LQDDHPSFELIASTLPPLSSFVYQAIEKLLLPKVVSRFLFPKSYWTGTHQMTTPDINRTRLLSLTFEADFVDTFQQRCRTEKTSVNAALLATLLLAITSVSTRKDTEFFCNTAVNIRRFCQPPVSNQQVGVFVSGADSTHYVPHTERSTRLLWPLAREVKEQINEQIDTAVLPLIQSLRFVSNWFAFLKDQHETLPNGLQHSVDISNLLRWNFEESLDQWKIIRGGFVQSSNIVGSVFTLSAVTVNGVLQLYLTFQEKVLQEMGQDINQIMRCMREMIMEAVNSMT